MTATTTTTTTTTSGDRRSRHNGTYSMLLLVVLILLGLGSSPSVRAFSARPGRAPSGVVVSGAGSGVGKIVVGKLLALQTKQHQQHHQQHHQPKQHQQPSNSTSCNKFMPIALVENAKEARELERMGTPPTCIAQLDLMDKKAVRFFFKNVNCKVSQVLAPVHACECALFSRTHAHVNMHACVHAYCIIDVVCTQSM
jgi:hypothetical protein